MGDRFKPAPATACLIYPLVGAEATSHKCELHLRAQHLDCLQKIADTLALDQSSHKKHFQRTFRVKTHLHPAPHWRGTIGHYTDNFVRYYAVQSFSNVLARY